MADHPDDLTRLRDQARDGLYVAVGFGVLGYQRLRIARRAIAERLGTDEPDRPSRPPAGDGRPWLDLRPDESTPERRPWLDLNADD